MELLFFIVYFIFRFFLHSFELRIASPLVYKLRGQKFHSSSRYYERNLERASDSTQCTGPVGRVLWEEELLEEVITPIYSLLHTLLKDKCMGLQDE